MTAQPPPPPPPSASVGIPAWALYAGAAAVAAVVAVFGFGLLGGDDDGTAAAGGTGPLVTFADGSSTTVAPSTTDGVTTSAPTSSSTSTTSSTTTTSTSTTTTSTTTTTTLPPYLLEDRFDGPSPAFPLFAPEFVFATVSGGLLEIQGRYAGILPVMYPNPYPDSEITMWFWPQQQNPNALFGAIVLAEDPTDFALGHYVLVYVNPDTGKIGAFSFDSSLPAAQQFGQDLFVDIPVSAAFSSFDWNELRMVVSGSTVDVYLNGVFALTWSGAATGAPGWWGPVVVGGEDSDSDLMLDFPDVMLVDDVTVEALAG